jgi:sRNA-binding carbon storage regulator CsrA
MLVLTRTEGEAIRVGDKSRRLAITHIGNDFVDVEGLGCQPYDTPVDLGSGATVAFRRAEYQGNPSGQIKCAFEAPRSVAIDREEVWLKKQRRG